MFLSIASRNGLAGGRRWRKDRAQRASTAAQRARGGQECGVWQIRATIRATMTIGKGGSTQRKTGNRPIGCDKRMRVAPGSRKGVGHSSSQVANESTEVANDSTIAFGTRRTSPANPPTRRPTGKRLSDGVARKFCKRVFCKEGGVLQKCFFRSRVETDWRAAGADRKSGRNGRPRQRSAARGR